MERKINKKYSINLLNSIVPISQFNKGQAGKIFNDVKENGAKIVIKNNEPALLLTHFKIKPIGILTIPPINTGRIIIIGITYKETECSETIRVTKKFTVKKQ